VITAAQVRERLDGTPATRTHTVIRDPADLERIAKALAVYEQLEAIQAGREAEQRWEPANRVPDFPLETVAQALALMEAVERGDEGLVEAMGDAMEPHLFATMSQGKEYVLGVEAAIRAALKAAADWRVG